MHPIRIYCDRCLIYIWLLLSHQTREKERKQRKFEILGKCEDRSENLRKRIIKRETDRIDLS